MAVSRRVTNITTVSTPQVQRKSNQQRGIDMNRRTTVSAALSLLCSPVVLLAGNATGIAQQSDTASVSAAINGLHNALSALDVKKMDDLWVHDSYVTLVNPRDRTVTVGWDAVRKNWEATFAFWSELKVHQLGPEPNIHINGRVACLT